MLQILDTPSKLKVIEEKNARTEKSTVCHTNIASPESTGFKKTLRNTVLPCSPPSCNKDPRTLPCVTCAKVEHKKCRDKFRLCEYDSTKKFIDVAGHNKDVFTRNADRLRDDIDSSVKSIVSADVYFHNLCR